MMMKGDVLGKICGKKDASEEDEAISASWYDDARDGHSSLYGSRAKLLMIHNLMKLCLANNFSLRSPSMEIENVSLRR